MITDDLLHFGMTSSFCIQPNREARKYKLIEFLYSSTSWNYFIAFGVTICNFFFAGTGDHTFERRLRLGGPLLKENIATMVLERYQTAQSDTFSN